MKLTLQIAVLSASLGGLCLWERALSSSEEEQRRANIRVGRLVSSEQADEIQRRTAAVHLEGENNWLYVLTPQGWRILGYWGAPAVGSKIEGVANALRNAEGVIQSKDEADYSSFGIGEVGDGPSWRVTFHGNEFLQTSAEGQQNFVGDPIYQVEVGHAVPGLEGCYVRVLDPPPPAEQRGVWAVDQSPLGALQSPAAGLPPMLEPHVLPASWMGQGRRIERVEVQRRDAAYELVLEMRELTAEQRRDREQSYQWALRMGGQSVPYEGALTSIYTYFLYRLPFAAVIDATRVDAQALVDGASAVVRLHSSAGEPIEVLLGPPLENGTRLVRCSLTGCYYLVAEEACELFAPLPQSMFEGATENPWEAFLQPPQ